jgi:hypothetical protein
VGPLADVLPVQLESQRSVICDHINKEVHRLASHNCSKCDVIGYDNNLIVAIGQRLTPKLERWPPQYIKYHSIRDVLSVIGSMGPFMNFELDPKKPCAKHDNLRYRPAEQFKGVADGLGEEAYGLCYRCTKTGTTFLECQHKYPPYDLMKRMSELDPLV